uniref:Dolichyl-diphosphooligosaccharide-protein glycosyltransferase subunit TMEM258 n=1 Tax=Globodera rostochiensis TaxID=31243 RepID=A0A914GNX8_GLORO
MAVDISKMVPFSPPVSQALFPHLTIVLLAIGLVFTAWFFVHAVTSTMKTRNLFKELFIGTLASSFLGFGTVFLMLWVGIYV